MSSNSTSVVNEKKEISIERAKVDVREKEKLRAKTQIDITSNKFRRENKYNLQIRQRVT